MKRLLKALLMLAAVLAVVYLSSPWWIPPILARQLPADWQLETLKISWPGFEGINVRHLKANGRLPGMDVVVEAENSRLSYQGLATQVDSVVLRIVLSSEKDTPTQPLSIDDLSLPMFHLSANLPTLAVKQAQIALHLASGSRNKTSNPPIIFDIKGFKLDPADQEHFRINTTATIVGQENINGYISAEVNPEKLTAHVRFPADKNQPPWLNLEFVQVTNPGTSELNLNFDAGSSTQTWLNELLHGSSNGRLRQVGGQLQVQVFFDGDQKNHLKRMRLKSQRFEIDFDGDKAIADISLQAIRNGQSLNIDFLSASDTSADSGAGAGNISIVEQSGKIEKAIQAAVPELIRAIGAEPGPVSNTNIEFGHGSELELILPEDYAEKIQLNFSGGLALGYSTINSGIELGLSDLNLKIEDPNQIGNVNMTGNLDLSWTETLPFSYNTETLSFAANSLSLRTKGKLDWEPQSIRFQSTDSVNAQLSGLKAKIQTSEPPSPAWIELSTDELKSENAFLGFDLAGSTSDTTINYQVKGPISAGRPKITLFSASDPAEAVVSAAELHLTGSLVSDGDQIMSSGDGYLNKFKVMPLAATATQLELDWADISLTHLTGAVNAKTNGFKVILEEETWTGFDLESSLKLEKDDVVNGSGNLTFDGGTAIPLKFSGNISSGWWDVDLLKNTLPLADMRPIMRSAHVELPTELKLTDGSIDVEGHIEVRDEISAKLDLSGAGIATDLAETTTQQTSFSLNAGYGEDVYASGPVAVKKLGLAGGVDITDISTVLNLLNSDAFGLQELSALLFDGQLNINQLNYADGAIDDTTINLTHINLQKLLAFLDVDGLDGAGFIDFSLPAGSKGAAIHIVDGSFTSTEPGRLSYSKGDMASTNIGLQALENFHYDKLSGNIAYDSTGPYQITIHLEGSNPDLYDGYPLVFNLSINGSLPELFEAMFLTGSFEDSILKQVNMKESQ